MIAKYPLADMKFQFCAHSFWKKLGGPSHVEVGDTYVLRESERGYPSVNWQTPIKITGTFVLLAETAMGHSIRLRDEASERVIGITEGHIIRSTSYSLNAPVEDWAFREGDTISLWVTPYGYDRAIADDKRRTK